MLLQPFLRLLTHLLCNPNARQGTDTPEEVLKAGALYRESPVTADAADAQVPDDGELGGVHLGQVAWEGLEGALNE
ncbi:hypothetical protein EV702DRAFT_1104753 [Suillus placidus]|uniref:Uncharacterized protein n=1 Tax=Suillus placidus TaxID=48579 RepID=A0A9P6ZUG3_9AGAM|nr:hypothetical protein EV702DRAFT_1104753 [Suillus placidus]